MTPPKSRDTRLQKKRATRELGQLFERAMAGEVGPGAEGAAVALLSHLLTSYVEDEGPLGAKLRTFIALLSDKHDPLRRDVDPALWAALWPALNTLAHARRTHEQQRQEAEAPRAGPGPADAGPGLLRLGEDAQAPHDEGQGEAQR